MASKLTTKTTIAWGTVQGSIPVEEDVRAQASQMAAHFYGEAETSEFSGELVESFAVPEWAPAMASWFPTVALAAMGLERGKAADEFLATAGIDAHQDHIHGPVLIWVLHNDGLTFKQGKASHKTAAGEWFVFDDRQNHGVKECKGAGAYLCWAVPLQEINKSRAAAVPTSAAP